MSDLRCPIGDVPRALAAAGAAGFWPARSALFHDLDRIRARADELRRCFPADTLHAVAVKANPILALLSLLVEQGMGLETASWEEVQCALAAGCPPDRVVYDSPAKTAEELASALRTGVRINADHGAELLRLEQLGATRDDRIGLRVNPMVGVGSIAATSTVGRSSKFGVSLDEAAALVGRFPFVTGLHVHTGSQGVGLALIQQAVTRVAELAHTLSLTWLDVGGGLPVQYRDTDPEPPTYAAWAASLAHVQGLQLVTEPGRSVLAASGWAISRIEAVKQVDGTPTLVVHVGADLLLRRVYRGDQWDHEFVVLDPHGYPKPGPLEPSGCLSSRSSAASTGRASIEHG